MTLVETVQAARSPRAAMLEIAAAIDVLIERVEKLEQLDSWDEWPDEPSEDLPAEDEAQVQAQLDDFEARHAAAVARMANDKPTEIVLPKPSEEKWHRRLAFARDQLKLGADQADAYAKGGPYWFYCHDRDAFMSYGWETRRAMVADIDEDNKELAAEVSRDALKRENATPDFETGAGALAVGTIGTKQAKR